MNRRSFFKFAAVAPIAAIPAATTQATTEVEPPHFVKEAQNMTDAEVESLKQKIIDEYASHTYRPIFIGGETGPEVIRFPT